MAIVNGDPVRDAHVIKANATTLIEDAEPIAQVDMQIAVTVEVGWLGSEKPRRDAMEDGALAHHRQAKPDPAVRNQDRHDRVDLVDEFAIKGRGG